MKGATLTRLSSRSRPWYFNPRSREGSDISDDTDEDDDSNFNPRSREGSDIRVRALCHAGSNFNPRSREGSDQRLLIWQAQSTDFNPRSREASDPTAMAHHNYPCGISIHAPVKGATPAVPRLLPDLRDFNPRSREGSDRWPTLMAGIRPISIHAPVKGATGACLRLLAWSIFQSTLP